MNQCLTVTFTFRDGMEWSSSSSGNKDTDKTTYITILSLSCHLNARRCRLLNRAHSLLSDTDLVIDTRHAPTAKDPPQMYTARPSSTTDILEPIAAFFRLSNKNILPLYSNSPGTLLFKVEDTFDLFIFIVQKAVYIPFTQGYFWI